MFNIIFYLILLLALPLNGYAPPLSQDDEKGIRALFEEHYNAWNQHDAKKMADLYASDGDLRTSGNRKGKDHDEIEAIFLDQHSHQMREAHIEGSIDSIQLVKPDVAFVDGESTVTGMQTLEKNKFPRLHHHVVFLLVKRDGQWKILVGRPF